METEARSSTDQRRRADASPKRYGRVITVMSMDRDRNCCWLQRGMDDEGNAVPTLVIDARCFHQTLDGGHDGRSHAVQRKLVAKTPRLRWQVQRLKRFLSRHRQAPRVAVHAFCNRGKHWSVALAEQFYQLLANHVREYWAYFDDVRLIHRSLDRHRHEHKGCTQCLLGRISPLETKQRLAAEYVVPLWDEYRDV